MKKLILIILLIPYIASAVIVTGVPSPSSFSYNTQAVYDFDNNGQYDLSLKTKFLGGGNYTLVIKGMNGTKIETDGSFEVMGYNSGTPLGVNTYQDSGFVNGLYFPEMTEKYVGFKFKINGNYCCAYLKIRAEGYSQGYFSIQSFGYETNNNICITAGATPANINEATVSNFFNVYPNPSNGKFTIELENKQLTKSNNNIEIYNLVGEKVYTTSTFMLLSLTEIDLSVYPKGIYLVKIYDGDNIYTKKISLK